jgi:hypothetical protein
MDFNHLFDSKTTKTKKHFRNFKSLFLEITKMQIPGFEKPRPNLSFASELHLKLPHFC